jgi:hypothetical protein
MTDIEAKALALVERLREAQCPDNMGCNPLAKYCQCVPMDEAAERIEAQAAEIERLRSLVYLYVDPFDVTPEDEDFVQAAQRAALGQSE